MVARTHSVQHTFWRSCCRTFWSPSAHRIGWLSGLLIGISFVATGVYGQEKIKIDDRTVSIVPSPWKLQTINSQASLRGLHVPDNQTVWASGTGGTIIHTSDAGATWKVSIVKGAESLDFRDIHAIDEATVVAMTSGTPARVYRSTNGGISWKKCYENLDKRVFLDALTFWDDQNGIIMGDPIDNQLFLLRTDDGGRTWKQSAMAPRTAPGEAGFAASGTNAINVGTQSYFVALGGAEQGKPQKTSRILFSPDRGAQWLAGVAPFRRTESSGIFSLCFADSQHGVAVGGDYKVADSQVNNYATTNDGGKTWTTPNPRKPPSGYRSGVALSRSNREIQFVAVGPNGTDLSVDMGNQWRRISNEGFHAVAFSPDGSVGWASGGDGRIAKWTGKTSVKAKARQR